MRHNEQHLPMPETPQDAPETPSETAAPRSRRVFNSRAFRLSLGVALIALAGVLIVPRATSYTAEDAIVQGRTAMLSTPIEGTVDALPLAQGESVAAGGALASVANSRLDRSFLNELMTERDSLLRRIDALAAQSAGLAELQADLNGRTSQLKDATKRTLARETDARQADLRAVQADLKAARLALARTETLAAKQLTPLSQLDADRARVSVLQAEAERIQADIELLAEERRQVEAGIFVADGRYGAPYAEIRADEIAITKLDIAARKSEQETRVAQIERQIAEEERRLAKAGRAQIVSPHDGVVWRVLAARGSDLVTGQDVAEVLDCRSTFLEVLVSEKRFNATRVGETLNYRLVGSDGFHTGTVTARRGANAVAADRGLAANLTAARDSQFRVYAKFDTTSDGPTSATNADGYCDVGRHAEVRFPTALGEGLSNPLALLQGLFE